MRTYAWLSPDQAAPADQRVHDRYFDRRIRADVFLLNDRLASELAASATGAPWSTPVEAGR
jgi:hypothetical protein